MEKISPEEYRKGHEEFVNILSHMSHRYGYSALPMAIGAVVDLAVRGGAIEAVIKMLIQAQKSARDIRKAKSLEKPAQ